MSSPWLVRFGTEEQRRRYLPPIARGEIVCALAITEPGAGSDMARLSTRARRDGDHWVLTGAKTFITNGVHGDLYFVAARTRDDGPPHRGLSQFLVERGTPGLIVSRTLDKTGMRASDTAELAFDGVRVPAANLLGEEGRGFYQLASGLQRERLMAAVLCVAASQRALEDCQAYLQHRQAFGRPLAEMQVLRHRLADMATRIEAARRLTYHAAALFGDGQPCEREVSMAKLFAAEMASAIGFDAVQLHGGYGYMREFPVERFARDYRLWTIASGTSEMMREIIAKKLL
jgi:acyl-CoA dehydrogenase